MKHEVKNTASARVRYIWRECGREISNFPFRHIDFDYFHVSYLHHSVTICFFIGPLCMLSAQHIIPIFIISSSQWFSHAHLCLAKQVSVCSSPTAIYVFLFRVPYSYELRSYQEGSVLSLQCFPAVRRGSQFEFYTRSSKECWTLVLPRQA